MSYLCKQCRARSVDFWRSQHNQWISEVIRTIFVSYDYLIIVYPVCVFHDHWSFCLVAMATLKFKKVIFKWQPQNNWSSMTFFGTNINWVRATENSKTFTNPPLGLVAMTTENSHWLIMRKWLNCIFSITSEVMWTIFGSYDHWMIVHPVYVFYNQRPFCMVARAKF